VHAVNRLVFSSCLLLTATTFLVAMGSAQTPSASDDSVKQQTEPPFHLSMKLPVRLYKGYLVIVEGAIGDVHKLNFLVDTGACPSVVDQKIARDLKLPEQPERVNLWNKSVQTRQVVIPSLSLGPVRVESIPVLAEDLSFLQKALGIKVHAIVGMDVLRKSSFTINYKSKEILFGAPESLTYFVPFETDTPVVTVRIGFQDRRLRMVVDSGGPDLSLFRSRVSEPTGLQALGTESVADAGGTFQRTKVRIPELHIGKQTVGAQMAFLVDDRKDEGDDFDGVLGVGGLQFGKVAFDFENRRFSWELIAVAPPITAGGQGDVQLPPSTQHESSLRP
jgi:Aspartyl protease